MTGRDLFTGQPSVPPGSLTELAALRATIPGYDVAITCCAGQFRYEAVRRPGNHQIGPWCLISTDAGELRRELAAGFRAAPLDGDCVNRARSWAT